MNKITYKYLDLFRIIAAVFVVAIHTSPFQSLSELSKIFGYINIFTIQIVARVAVPFFFTASGFFLFGHIKSLLTFKVRKYILKVIKLYFLWSLVYLPIRLAQIYVENGINLIGVLYLVRDIILTGTFTQLWFLNALVVSVFIIYMLLKKLNFYSVLYISLGLYIFGLFGDSYFGLSKNIIFLNNLFIIYNKIFVTTRNGLFFGMFFVMLGGLISNTKIEKSKLTLFLFLFSFFLMTIEVYLLKKFNIAKDFNMLIMLIPNVYFLFKYLVSLKHFDCPKCYLIRNISFLVFCIHMIYVFIVANILEYLGLDSSVSYNPLLFMITIICSFLSSIIIIRMSNTKKFKFLNAFY